MAMASRPIGNDESVPLPEVNTTPLIDVMLVLIVMILISLPMQLDALKLDVLSGPASQATQPTVNKVAIDFDGRLSLNGTPTALADLRTALAQAPHGARVEFHADAYASYDRVLSVLSTINRSGHTAIGFAGLKRFE
jgi:biopolymer transport protein ExbD